MFGFEKYRKKKRAEFRAQLGFYIEKFDSQENIILTEDGRKVKEKLASIVRGDDFDLKEAQNLLVSLRNPYKKGPALYKTIKVHPDLRDIRFRPIDLVNAWRERNFENPIWMDAANSLAGKEETSSEYVDLWFSVNSLRAKFRGEYLAPNKRFKKTAEEAASYIFHRAISIEEPTADEAAHEPKDRTKYNLFIYRPAVSSHLKQLISERHLNAGQHLSPDAENAARAYLYLNNFSENYPDLTDEQLLKCVGYLICCLELELIVDENSSEGALKNESLREQIETLNDFLSDFITRGSMEGLKKAMRNVSADFGDTVSESEGVIGYIELLKLELPSIKIKLKKSTDSINESVESARENPSEAAEKIKLLQRLLDSDLITSEEFKEKRADILNQI
jgi:hypothetical protein